MKPHTGQPQDSQADRPVRAEGELVMREDGWFLRISIEELRRLEREAAESLSNSAESTA